MSLSQAISELQNAQHRTENAFYCLRNLRNAIQIMAEEGQPLTQQQIAEILDEALVMLAKAVEGEKS